MAATYDLSMDVGKVRLRIPDTNVSLPMFDDEELQVFLDAYNGDDNAVFFAAADALEVVAGDPARVQQFSRGSMSSQRTAADAIWQKINSYRSRGGVQVGTVERSDFWCDP